MPRRLAARSARARCLAAWVFAISAATASPARAEAELDVESELAISGVKLLVVDFFATWCDPCMDAVPKWEALRRKYGKDGLRLVVVAVKDDEETCKDVPWTPDKIICDTDGEIAKRFGVDGLPAAFLWNWQGHLLGNKVHPEAVEEKIEGWMRAIPRVDVQVDEGLSKRAGIGTRELQRLIASELTTGGKLVVVASAAERERLRALAKASFRLGADEETTCDLGKEVSANNLLDATITRGSNKQLRLGLLSAESHCRTRDVASPWNPRRPEVSVAKAVTKLMGRLRRPELQRPPALQLSVPLTPERSASSGAPATVSYEAMLAQAREAEERAENTREEPERVRGARMARLEKDWAAVSKVAKAKALPKSQRAAALDQFLSDFPDDNPHLETAKTYRALLRDGKEPNAAPEGMVEVPGGEFFMGCNEQVDSECDDDERPGRTVNVDTFFIDRTEVTVDAYAACVRAEACTDDHLVGFEWPGQDHTPSNYCNWGQSGRGNHPINCVDWSQAKAFCAWKGKRLPTEAEWEKAARGTDGRKHPWGNANATCRYVVMDDGQTTPTAGSTDGCGRDSTWPVGSKPDGASPYGALDMAGNVWEWTTDTYGSSSDRVRNGGGFIGRPDPARASYRYWYSPGSRFHDLGFRCASSP